MIQRKGRATKAQMIRKALERAHNKEEAELILDCSRFNLTWQERKEIVEDWDAIQHMLKVHEKGVYSTPSLGAVV
jgi:hypothetical protein